MSGHRPPAVRSFSVALEFARDHGIRLWDQENVSSTRASNTVPHDAHKCSQTTSRLPTRLAVWSVSQLHGSRAIAARMHRYVRHRESVESGPNCGTVTLTWPQRQVPSIDMGEEKRSRM